MNDNGQKIGGKTRLPIGDMAKTNLDKIFPNLTQEQVSAIREGKPVPPSPDWEGFSQANTQIPDTLFTSDIEKRFEEARAALRIAIRRNELFEKLLTVSSDRSDTPTVSAILVFSDKNRVRRARKAVNQFISQSYAKKQLVIVNTSDTDITNVPHRQILELKHEPATTGELRNYALSHANGDLIFPFWDDDDVYDPDLLTFLVAAQHGNKAVLMTNQLRVDITRSTIYSHREELGIPNTILYPKNNKLFSLQTGSEDFEFVQRNWALKTTVLDTATWPLNTLLMRVFDGNNVCSLQNFMVGRDAIELSGRWEIGVDEIEHVKVVLASFGLKAEARLPKEIIQPATM